MAVRWSTRVDGDFHRTAVSLPELEHRRRSFVDLPWTMLDQVHCTTVVRVTEPGGGDGARGDVAITNLHDVVLGCWAADCAPLVLVGAENEFAVVHAGWRGLAAGVIDAAVAAFDEPIVDAVLGPAIHACCYEFGRGDLDEVAEGVHALPPDVIGRTAGGAIGLDVPAAVAAGCGFHGIPFTVAAGCTGCAYDGFSHRVRSESGRHVVAAWRRSGLAP